MFNNVFWKSCRLRGNVEKYGTARYATDDSTIRGMRIACTLLYGHLWLQTQIQNKNNAFPWQKYLHEALLCYIYTYSASLVWSSINQ
jgi:hypothetical protein